MKSFLPICAVVLSVAVPYKSHAQSLTPSQQTEIESYILKQVTAEDPGVAIGVVRQGQIVLEAYYGLASLQHAIPVSAATRFNIASVAKQFTALMVLDLALKGKLNLDDDFRTYLDGFYTHIETPMPIRQIINHSSGIRDYSDLLGLQQKPWWRQVGFDNKDALALLAQQQELNMSPGSAHSYSNSNYTLLTELIASVSGQSFHEYAQAFFVRLGMHQTQFNKNYMAVIPHVALPYSDWGDNVWQQYPHLTNLYGDGFLYTTLKDQLTYEVTVQQAGSSDSELLVKSQQPIDNAYITSYGFGLELQNRLGRKAVHHSGSTGSYHAQTLRFPDEQLSIIVMSNNSNLWSGSIADYVASALLPAPAETASKSGPIPDHYALPRNPDALTGEYISPENTVVRIQQENDQLVWKRDNNNALPLIQESGSLYHFEYDPEIKVEFLDTTFVFYGSATEPRTYTKMPPFEPDISYTNGLTGTFYSSELDISLTLWLDGDGGLTLQNSARERTYPVQIIQKDQLLSSNYVLRPQRTQDQKIKALLLSYGRVQDLRFEKMIDSME